MTAGGQRPQDEKVEDPVPTRVIAGRRSWAVPAIGLVALAIVLVGFLGQKPVVPPRPTPVITEAPSPTPQPVGIAWTEVPLDPTTFKLARVGFLIDGPKGLVAFGQDGSDRHPITWTSRDGRAWTRHDQPPGAFGGGVPDAAVAGGPGFIAVGWHATADGPTRDIWTSPDGATWTRTPSRTGRDFTGVIALLGSGGTGVLVADQEGRQALLSSRDGQIWAPTPDLDATLGRGAFIYSATQAGSGFLAVGALGSDKRAVWRSDDGRDWAPVAPANSGLLVGAHLYRVFRTHAGFLATGFSDDPFGGGRGESAWVSPDGVTWTVGPTATDFGSRNFQTVFALGDGDLSASSDSRGFGGGVNWILRASVDTHSWFTVESPMDGPLDWTRQATTVDDRLVVLGWDAQRGAVVGWSGRLTRGAVPAGGAPTPSSGSSSPPLAPSPTATPTTPPVPPDATPSLSLHRIESRDVFGDPLADLSISGVVQFGSDVIGFGSAGPSAGLWRSVDPNHWQRLPVPPAMRGARITAATTFRDHLVAIGAITNADGVATPAAWTSRDGATWTRAKGAPDWSNLELTDIAAGPDGLVAVGRREDGEIRAGVWTSPNGAVWTPVPPFTSFPLDVGESEIRAIAYGAGGFVAVGRGQGQGPVPVAAVWASADGHTWAKVESANVFGSSDVLRGGRVPGLNDVVAWDSGYVAVGSAFALSGDVVGAVFTSPDGRSWTKARGDDLLDASEPSTVTTWSGGLALGANVRGSGGSHPVVWTSDDGSAWVPLDATDPVRGVAPLDETLSGLLGVGRRLIGVGSASSADGPGLAGVWVAARSGDLVADHVCPVRIDSLAFLARMSGADRSACIGATPIKVAALARAGTNDCGDAPAPPDLFQCGGYLELAPLDGGYPLMTVPLDPSRVGDFGVGGFTPWILALRTGLTPATCSEPVPGANGVIYEPVEATHLQCRALLRVVSYQRIVHR